MTRQHEQHERHDHRTHPRSAPATFVVAITLAVVVLSACGAGGESASPAGATKQPASADGTTAPHTSGPNRTDDTTPLPGTEDAPTDTVWLCRPGLRDNPCEGDFTTSAIAADGTTTVQQAAPAKDPPIDCFYVYPTVSQQPTPNADLTVDPAETSVARAQAARFSQVCKVYAPMYRQLTLSAIGNRSGITAANTATAYGDVENAWKDYLAHDNHGRGVVLIGHSQGAGQLTALIKRQIDGQPATRGRLVSALLLGGNVMVPTGKDVGGSFANVPACRAPDQTGCVVAYSTFLDPPPANAMFGRSRTPGQEVLCTNPAALAGGAATLHPELPTGAAAAVGSLTTGGPSDARPWVTYPGLYTGECQDADGANVLRITPTPGPGDTRPVVRETLGPTWGLHLVDVNIALGDLVDVVGSEARAFGH